MRNEQIQECNVNRQRGADNHDRTLYCDKHRCGLGREDQEQRITEGDLYE